MSDPTEQQSKIFKIFKPSEWDDLCRDGQTLGSPLDAKDGFLHFSTIAQLSGTLALHFKGAGPLVLAEIPLDHLSDRVVKWEAARDGSLFPHLYGALRTSDITYHWTLTPDQAGHYGLPNFEESQSS